MATPSTCSSVRHGRLRRAGAAARCARTLPEPTTGQQVHHETVRKSSSGHEHHVKTMGLRPSLLYGHKVHCHRHDVGEKIRIPPSASSTASRSSGVFGRQFQVHRPSARSAERDDLVELLVDDVQPGLRGNSLGRSGSPSAASTSSKAQSARAAGRPGYAPRRASMPYASKYTSWSPRPKLSSRVRRCRPRGQPSDPQHPAPKVGVAHHPHRRYGSCSARTDRRRRRPGDWERQISACSVRLPRAERTAGTREPAAGRAGPKLPETAHAAPAGARDASVRRRRSDHASAQRDQRLDHARRRRRSRRTCGRSGSRSIPCSVQTPA